MYDTKDKMDLDLYFVKVKNMKELILESVNAIQNVTDTFSRINVLRADWNERLIAVQGHRGSGKTTLLLQYLKQLNKPDKSIYISMDHFYFQQESMYETVKALYQQGYRYFVLDEVHKYLNWSIELKSLYDTYRELRIIFTGSSALEIYKSNADLSRRAVDFQLPVMSLREFIIMETGKKLDPITLDALLTNHTSLAMSINKKIGSPLKYFKNYLQYGCYPFFNEGTNQYPAKLMRTTNLVLEVDIAAVTNIPYNSINKMKRLLAFISQSVPFKPNITQLAEKIESKRETTLQYLIYLQRAGVVRLLSAPGKSLGPLSKPDKIYLDNPNLAYALSYGEPNQGNVRETFFISQVSARHQLAASTSGDFIVDQKYTFEIGGKNKQSAQIKHVKNSFVVKDDLLAGSGQDIPLWLFGFLY